VIATFVNTFESLDPRLALLALAFHLANFGFRAVAWRNVLRPAYPEREVPLFGIAGAYAAGVAANSFMPARGGDLVKIGLARSRIRGSSVATIAASMAVISSLDALIGVLAIIVLGALGLLPSPPGLPTLPAAPGVVAGHVAILGALGLAVVVTFFVVRRGLVARLALLWNGVKRGLSVLTQPRRYATEVVPFQLAAWASRVRRAGDPRRGRDRRRRRWPLDTGSHAGRRRHAAGLPRVRPAHDGLDRRDRLLLRRHAGRDHEPEPSARAGGGDDHVPHVPAGCGHARPPMILRNGRGLLV
jgi:lysylphosphatidylglycerol synthase-like protein